MIGTIYSIADGEGNVDWRGTIFGASHRVRILKKIHMLHLRKKREHEGKTIRFYLGVELVNSPPTGVASTPFCSSGFGANLLEWIFGLDGVALNMYDQYGSLLLHKWVTPK